MPKVDFPEVIDSTLLADWRSCQMKAGRAHFQHWRSKEPSIHLHAGACFAHGLEVARQAFFGDSHSAPDSVALGVQAALVSYGDFDSSGHVKSAIGVAKALEFYFDKWPLGADGKPPHQFPDGKLGIEFNFLQPLPFTHPVTGNPILYSGRADMICDFSGGLWLEDDKTATQLGQSWLNQWRLRSQFTGYCWAAQQVGIQVAGVSVRGVSFLKTGFGAAEGLYARLPWQIDRWLTQVIRDLREMERVWAESDWGYNLDHACSEYGGCQFLDSCEAQNPQEWLPMSFARRQWNPVTRIETLLEGPCPDL